MALLPFAKQRIDTEKDFVIFVIQLLDLKAKDLYSIANALINYTVPNSLFLLCKYEIPVCSCDFLSSPFPALEGIL